MAGAIVNSVYAVDDSGGTSTTISVTINGVTAGNLLAVMAGFGDAGTVTASASDGTSYTVGDSKRRDTNNNQSSQAWFLSNAGSGSHVCVVTFSTAVAFRRVRIAECSGLATASALDQGFGQFQATPGSGANGVSSGASAATTNANDFVLGLSQDCSEGDPGSGTLTAGTGYTISGANVLMALESKNVSATGAQTATFTQSVGSNSRTTHVIALVQAAAGGATWGPLLGNQTNRLVVYT